MSRTFYENNQNTITCSNNKLKKLTKSGQNQNKPAWLKLIKKDNQSLKTTQKITGNQS